MPEVCTLRTRDITGDTHSSTRTWSNGVKYRPLVRGKEGREACQLHVHTRTRAHHLTHTPDEVPTQTEQGIREGCMEGMGTREISGPACAWCPLTGPL